MQRKNAQYPLRKLFGKGYIDVLIYLDEKGDARFNDIRKFCLDFGVVRSRGTVPTILKNLTNLKLVKRKVVATRPVQTHYGLTELGKQVTLHLKHVKQLLSGRET